MKKIGLSVFASAFLLNAAHSASLLQPVSFPKTASDLTFSQNIALKAEGYEPWESLYDPETGRCISGCLYPGITIPKEIEITRQNTDSAANAVLEYIDNLSGIQGIFSPGQGQIIGNIIQGIKNKEEKVKELLDKIKDHISQTPLNNIVAQRCEPNNANIQINQQIPLGSPLVEKTTITSEYGPRENPYGVHKGIDFSVHVGTDVFSTASGVVSKVLSDDTCGIGLVIKHQQDFETVYCHLSKVDVKKGDIIEAGCKIAESGNTGRSTGPHLHYGIKYKDNYIDPKDYITGA